MGVDIKVRPGCRGLRPVSVDARILVVESCSDRVVKSEQLNTQLWPEFHLDGRSSLIQLDQPASYHAMPRGIQ